MDDMSPEVVLKHVNKAHKIPGMAFFGKSRIPGDENEDLIRAWHKQKHEQGEFDHTHGPSRERYEQVG